MSENIVEQSVPRMHLTREMISILTLLFGTIVLAVGVALTFGFGPTIGVVGLVLTVFGFTLGVSS